jgi:hypothetical protein
LFEANGKNIRKAILNDQSKKSQYFRKDTCSELNK